MATKPNAPEKVLKSGQKGYKWSDQQRARFLATRAAQNRARKLLEQANASSDPSRGWSGPGDASMGSALEQALPEQPKPKRRASSTMLYALAQHAREAIHQHVRRGGQLEELHTAVLALTDAMMKGEEE